MKKQSANKSSPRTSKVFLLNFKYHQSCFTGGALCNCPELLESSTHEPLANQLYTLICDAGDEFGYQVKNYYFVDHNKASNLDGSFMGYIIHSGCLEHPELYTSKQYMHMHVLVELTCDSSRFNGLTIKEISQITGLNKEHIVIPKKTTDEVSFFNDVAAGLIHFKDTFKLQYDVQDVHNYFEAELGGMAYVDLYTKSYDAWYADRVAKKNKELARPIYKTVLQDKIMNGELGINPEEAIMDDHLWNIVYQLKKNKSDIKCTCSVYQDMYYEALAEALHTNMFDKAVIFVYGPKGTGKSTFCEQLSVRIQEATKNPRTAPWTSVRLHGRNPFTRYNSQQIVILDEVKCNDMEPELWWSSLDKFRSSTSRRNRKTDDYALAVLMNQGKSPVDFFIQLTEEDSYCVLDKFLRRIHYSVELRVLDGQHEARLIPTVHLSEPKHIKGDISANYYPDESQASDWMPVDQACSQLTDFVVKHCHNLGVVLENLNEVVDCEGNVVKFRKSIEEVYGHTLGFPMMQFHKNSLLLKPVKLVESKSPLNEGSF